MSGPTLTTEQANLQEITPEIKVEPVVEPKKIEKPLVQVKMGQAGVQLTSMDEASRFCAALLQSGFVPERFKTAGAVFSAVQMGAELGMTPMVSLQSIAVIEGTPTIYGDAALALVRQSGLLEDYSEEIVGTGDDRKAVVMSKRKGMPKPIISEFSVADAKLAHLWNKKTKSGNDTPWVRYPERMMRLRARGFNLRDNFADILKGFKTTEEVQDYAVEEEKKGPTLTE